MQKINHLFTLLLLLGAVTANAQYIPSMQHLQLHESLSKKLELLNAERNTPSYADREAQVTIDLLAFYHAMANAKPVWFNGNAALNNRAKALRQYIASDPRLATAMGPLLHKLSALENGNGYAITMAQKADLEIALTRCFLRVAAVNLHGWITPSDFDGKIGWFIPRRTADFVAVLESTLRGKSVAEALDSLLPKDPKFRQLHEHWRKLQHIAANGGWPVLPTDMIGLELNDTSVSVPLLRERLFISQDYHLGLSDDEVYDSLLMLGVQHFQQRHGLEVDGKVGKNTLHALNIPVAYRMQQVAANLERAKWLPDVSKGRAIWVNIPEFKLYLLNNGEVEQVHKVAVGSVSNRTLAFSSQMQSIVVNPYWNVPVSIFRNELTPKAQNGTEYLSNRNYQLLDRSGRPVQMDTVNWHDPSIYAKYRIRQQPGGGNALGKVKFNFSNDWSIYIHDTPSKHTFHKAFRAVSHGCIRLQHPQLLATKLLQGHPVLQQKSVAELIGEGETREFLVPEHVSVHLVYMTAWVDGNGKLQLRNDVYGQDRQLMDAFATISS